MSKCRTYNKKVTVKKVDPNATADAHGHVDKSDASNWIQQSKQFCRTETKGGREFWKVDQVNAEVNCVFWCPYSTEAIAITPEMQIHWEGNTYEIASVVDVDLAHEEIEIQTVRAV